MSIDRLPSSFASQNTAIRLREVIKRFSNNVVQEEVPRQLVGRMISVDLPRLRGTVWFAGDDQPTLVSLMADAVPAQWAGQSTFVGVDSTSTSGGGSQVVCERLNGTLYVTKVLSGGQAALDFKALNSSLLLQEAADTLAGDPSANAAVDIAGDPYETCFNLHVFNSALLDGEAIEFGPFTTFDPGTPGPGLIEMSVTVEGTTRYYRFVTNPASEYDTSFYTTAKPAAWFNILANQVASYHEASAPYTDTTYFDLAITFRKSAYGNTDAFSKYKEMWFRLVRRKSINSTGLDARITLRATNVQKGRSLGGRELFMQERNISPELAMGRVGFDNSSHVFGQFTGIFQKDTFGKAPVAAGWGKTDWSSAETWTIRSGTAADFSTDGQYGLMAVNAVNSIYEIGLTSTVTYSVDNIVTFIVPAVATGAQIQVGASFADTPVTTANRYSLAVDFKTDSSITMTFRKKVAATTTIIGSATATGLTYSAGTKVNIRYSVDFLNVPSTLNYLKMKVWISGTDEPEAWLKDIVDSSFSFSDSSQALYVLRETGNTNTNPYTVKFDVFNAKGSRYSVDVNHPETWHNGVWRSAVLRTATDLQKTWTCDGKITWDGTYFKWTGNIWLSGVGRNPDGLRYGRARIAFMVEDANVGPLFGRVPTDPGGSDPSQGLIQLAISGANGFPLLANQGLWCAIPPDTGWDNLFPYLFILDGNVARDYELPEWAVLIAHRGPTGVCPEIRLGNGTFIDKWRAFTLQNSWANRGAGFPPLSYRMLDSPPNTLQIVGQVTGGVLTAGTVLATLPVGFRPITEQNIINNTGHNIAAETNGNIQIFAGAGTVIQINSMITLDL